MQERLRKKGKRHHGNRGGCKARMEKLKIKTKGFWRGRYRGGHTSGSRGSGGVTDEKAVEGLERSGGMEGKEDVVEQENSRMWAVMEPQPQQRG